MDQIHCKNTSNLKLFKDWSKRILQETVFSFCQLLNWINRHLTSASEFCFFSFFCSLVKRNEILTEIASEFEKWQNMLSTSSSQNTERQEVYKLKKKSWFHHDTKCLWLNKKNKMEGGFLWGLMPVLTGDWGSEEGEENVEGERRRYEGWSVSCTQAICGPLCNRTGSCPAFLWCCRGGHGFRYAGTMENTSTPTP